MKQKLITPKNIKRAIILVGSGGIIFVCAKYKIDPTPFLELLNNF